MSTTKTQTSLPGDGSESVSFDDKDTRKDEMVDEIEGQIEQMLKEVKETRSSKLFEEWLECMSEFHDYSYKNQLLIKRQKPTAEVVAGYKTWEKLGRYPKSGTGIWIWTPIISRKCPECGNAPSYHKHIDCNEDKESDTEEWSEGLVGFRPGTVFAKQDTEVAEDREEDEIPDNPDIQVKGGLTVVDDVDELYHAVKKCIEANGIAVEEVSSLDSNGSWIPRRNLIKIKERESITNQTRTLIHECGHALTHTANDLSNRRTDMMELEAEATAYVVAEHFGLDMAQATSFYLATWLEEDIEVEDVEDSIERISSAAETVIREIKTVSEDIPQ